MNNIESLLHGAQALQRGAMNVALAARGDGNAAIRATLLQSASGDLQVGADAVRLLGGPFFARMADGIAVHAEGVASGGPLAPAIPAAMDGARWLLGRVPHATG